MGTKPIRVITRWDQIGRFFVWHPINTDPHDDDRWTVRVWLPLYDALAILLGYVAYTIGSPLMNRLFQEWVVDSVAVLFIITGLVTMAGVIVPKLWRIEIGGKVVLSFLLITYALLVLNFPSKEVQNNSFVTIILIMATWGVYPRLTKLFIRGYRQSKKNKAVKA